MSHPACLKNCNISLTIEMSRKGGSSQFYNFYHLPVKLPRNTGQLIKNGGAAWVLRLIGSISSFEN